MKRIRKYAAEFTSFAEEAFASLSRYSAGERKGVLLLAFLFSGLLLIIASVPAKLNSEHLASIDHIGDSLRRDFYEKNFLKPRLFNDTAREPVRQKREYAPQRYAEQKRSIPEKVFIEINSADSALLVSARGVGPVISRNIINYRKKLGGFVDISQLKEVWGINDDNFGLISEQFYADTSLIQKIDVNFAPAEVLSVHPYFTRNIARRVSEGRKLKGGWSNIRELTDNDILLPGEARRLAPYLVFRTE